MNNTNKEKIETIFEPSSEHEKKRAFRDGDREQMRRVQGELKERIQQGKDSYRRKLEHKLQQNNLQEVWNGMRSITGYKPPGSQTTGGVLNVPTS